MPFSTAVGGGGGVDPIPSTAVGGGGGGVDPIPSTAVGGGGGGVDPIPSTAVLLLDDSGFQLSDWEFDGTEGILLKYLWLNAPVGLYRH